MTFSSSSLGQGARLNHSSFMNNNQPHEDSSTENSISNSPGRRGVVPVSYAYGAPTLGKSATRQTSPNRVPSPSRSTSSSARNRSVRPGINEAAENEEDIGSNISYNSSSAHAQESGAVRYARLKQRNQALGNSAYHPSGPGIILSPPDGANLRDTSVNVATAFHQAAHHAMPPASEQSKDAAANNHLNRRIAAPPSKTRKPPSQSGAPLKPPEETTERNGRSKSPILEYVSNAANALRTATSPTRYFLREGDVGESDTYQPLRMDEPPVKPPSRQSTKNSIAPSNESYDYEAEENYIRGEGSASGSSRLGHQKKKSATMSAAARLSLDNKAYRPPSDDEEEEDESDGDGVRRKRKGKKKDEGKGMTLPTIAYDKRKKRKSISKKSGASISGDLSASGDEQVAQPPEPRRSTSRQPSRPPSRTGSVVRDSVPPSHPAHFQPLSEVQELEDASYIDQVIDQDHHSPEQSDVEIHQMEAQSRTDTPSQRRFSIGALLGKIVHFIMSTFISILRRAIQTIAMVVFLAWTVIRGVYVVLVRTPVRWAVASARSAQRDFGQFSKLMFFSLAIFMAYAAVYPATLPPSTLIRWLTSRSVFPAYTAPTLPAESVHDLIARLTTVENTLADLARKEAQAHQVVQRAQSEAASRVELLHGRVEGEVQRAKEAEEQFRAAAARGIASVRSEFEALLTEWERVRTQATPGDDIAESFKELQERVSDMEGGVREALELGQASVKAGSGVGWWSKWANDDAKFTIKSSDGQDITGLIGSLVDHAVSRFSKDMIGKPDFALYSAGGRVIPHLTSNTYEIRPTSWTRYIAGAVTGREYTIGRPPVTALHPDTHVGNCWPFAGSRGQIGVLLARPNVLVSEVTIDHAPRDVAYDIRAAPRQMELWGLVEGADNISKVRAYQQSVRERREEALRLAKEKGVSPPPEEDPYPVGLPRSPHYIRLAQFTYDVHSPQHVQTFNVPKNIQDIGADFGVVVLIIKNNWGEDDFTCLYRVRVHGTDKDRRPYLLPERDNS